MNENEKTEIHNENHGDMKVGEILRNARTTGRRKREIQTISKQLCIREEFLQALEDGDYKAIPEEVYILGFARNYAMELGLDPDEIVNKIKREMGLVTDENDDCVEVAENNGEKGEENRYARFWGGTVKFVRRHWIWFVCGIVLLLAIIGGTIYVGISGNNENTSVSVTDTVVTEQTELSEGLDFNVEVRERFGTDDAESANVVLQATQDSWVKVEDARGNTVFSRVLVPGDVYYVPAGKGYSAVFGNAGGIDVWVNGKLAKKQGEDNARVSDISLNPDDLMR